MQHRKRCWSWGHGLSHDAALLAVFAGKMIYRVIINLILISIIFSLFTIHFQSIWAACGLHSFWKNVSVHVLYGAVEV